MEAALLRGLLFVVFGLLLFTDFPYILGRGRTDEQASEDAAKSFLSKKEKLAKIASTMKNSCLPKLICELNAAPEKDKLNQKARSLLQLIRDTSMGMTAEVTSRYHFAAHMGQLISGIDGTGCHNFYPACPLPTMKVLSLINKPALF